MPRPYNVININGHIVPATKHDAIKKILHDVGTGRIRPAAHAVYRRKSNDSVCMCAIGTFLPIPSSTTLRQSASSATTRTESPE